MNRTRVNILLVGERNSLSQIIIE